MKTIKSLVIAMSILASNAFALITSPYPRRSTSPDTNIVITDDRQDSVRSTVQASK
jgi:hypothetical protein